ncbi:MAG: DUF5985 family protein [Povalibacter sp.]
MASAVYFLGTVVTLLCASLLLRAYLQTKTKLLLWSGLCFVGLTIANALLWVDLMLLPQLNLYTLRLATAAGAMLLLLYGLIFESE